jgi:hypothetical protein
VASSAPRPRNAHTSTPTRCDDNWFSTRLITAMLSGWPLHSHYLNTSTAIASTVCDEPAVIGDTVGRQ